MTTGPTLLPGQYFDTESGLNYNYFRDYDPKTGRYIEPDPVGLNGGMNPYGYVDSVGKPSDGLNLFLYAENDPINFIDPTGLFREEGGTIFDDEGIPIGEAGLESPNPFLDPINYIGLGGGLAYKNTYWLKNACGLELKVSRNLRFGWHRLPKGNYPGAGKNLPHAHWRPGIGKHRPWETIFNKIRNWFN